MKNVKGKVAPMKKRCSHCLRMKINVAKRLNPYDLDVNGVKRYHNLCTACVDQLVADV